MPARIIIPPRGVGAGVCGTANGKYLAYVDTAVYVTAKNASVELPDIVFYEADPGENANQVRTELETRVKAAFGAPNNTPVVWMNV